MLNVYWDPEKTDTEAFHFYFAAQIMIFFWALVPVSCFSKVISPEYNSRFFQTFQRIVLIKLVLITLILNGGISVPKYMTGKLKTKLLSFIMVLQLSQASWNSANHPYIVTCVWRKKSICLVPTLVW
jgi:uncharacterized membrane protein